MWDSKGSIKTSSHFCLRLAFMVQSPLPMGTCMPLLFLIPLLHSFSPVLSSEPLYPTTSFPYMPGAILPLPLWAIWLHQGQGAKWIITFLRGEPTRHKIFPLLIFSTSLIISRHFQTKIALAHHTWSRNESSEDNKSPSHHPSLGIWHKKLCLENAVYSRTYHWVSVQ